MGAQDQTAVDFARAEHRDEWLHHPVIGDPSWDTFAREPGNPIYTGRPPYTWPVNGFLFRDPASGRWYACVGLYVRGYFKPVGLGPADRLAQCLAMREKPGGGWEELGIAVPGDKNDYAGDGQVAGAIPDVSVVFADGRYHMVYDWCRPDNSCGGLGYAWAEKPEGPFHCAPEPIHDDRVQAGSPLAGRYVRAYAGTLLRRKRDWLVLCMMSTPGNAGGTWAHAALTARNPERPWSAPTLLAYPQSDVFHPQLAEFFPAFAHDGFAYAPATSVAANRTFQVVFRAPIEEAHQPGAWSIHQYGSVWHAEPVPSEGMGIWGQTFSGQVAPDGTFRAYFPCKTREDVGTIGIARRPWNAPYGDGFWLSAPNAPAAAVLRRGYADLKLKAGIRATGPWSLGWGCAGPLGQDRIGADAVPHPLTRSARAEFRRSGSDGSIRLLDKGGAVRELASGRLVPAGAVEAIEIERSGNTVRVRVDGAELWSGEAAAEAAGRLELVAEKGTLLRVGKFEVLGRAEPIAESWLALDALSGAGEPPGNWREVQDGSFRWGVGFVSATPAARAKWNFFGRGFRLWAPKGPAFGECEVLVDGRSVQRLHLRAAQAVPSAAVLERELPVGCHAVGLRAAAGAIPCDSLEILP